MSIPPIGGDVPPTAPYGADPSMLTQDDKTMAMLAHLLGIFTYWVGPLIIYLIKKDQSKFVAYHAMQALIFQGACFVLSFVTIIPVLGWLILAAVSVLRIVFGVIACLAANRGEWYEIPVIGKFARQQAGI